MAVADRSGLPVAAYIESASPHEVKFVDATLLQMVIPEAPQNLIVDNAYNSDKLDTELKPYGIEVIAPHRSNRKNKTQDGRRLRRYRRRRKIEICLLGSRITDASSSVTSAMPRTSCECSTLGCCLIMLRDL
jgi:DDE family transposase